MIFQRLIGDGHEFLTKFLDIVCPVDDLSVVVPEDEISKTELVFDEVLYFPCQRERVFVDEMGVHFPCPALVVGLVALE